MGCLGVHFAVEGEVMERLLAATNDVDRSAIIEEIEEGGEYDEWSYDTDKAWDGLHRCLTDGNLHWDGGDYPLKLTILGGERLFEGEDYIICLTKPDEVKDVSMALRDLDQEELKRRYQMIPAAEYDVELGEDDFGYLWENFEGLRGFYQRASQAGRAVVFTADQ
ncbi:hypothetical protein Mal64_28110 [Pseudobythopirellula maris]|uniref:DUF1877 domain-containing protein n=1 Tax=Pseudobythopirellula maris TaxID=2527991 RepID=A0A5C5ZLF4_9BACT|nr:YfbM family protein [Pseudobythopirellula maris]TWT87273.1 hypothetical protein Mal64_28110 [Pseudobythopirellula maris]